jgi:hypothetical protein
VAAAMTKTSYEPRRVVIELGWRNFASKFK